jgi:hypothetical protein
MTSIDLPREKKMGHLTILRSPRKLTPREYNALSFGERLEMVRTADGRRKFDLILEAQDAERLVRQLPSQEIYLLIKEIGKEDVPELVQFASTLQITTFLDLDCWKGDLFVGSRALEWLALLMEGGEEKVYQTAIELEFELLVLMLKKLITVPRGPEDYLDDDARMEASQRDGGYEIHYNDAEGGKITAAFIDILHRHDRGFFAHLIEAVRWEQESLLEEEELQLRSGRLQDMGFPDPFESFAIHAWLDPRRFDPMEWKKGSVPSGEPTEAPGFVLTSARPRGILADVLSGGVDAETCWELTFVLNQVIMAHGVDMGDAVAVREAMAEVYRNINLALEHLAGSDAEKAARFFSDVHLQALFRLGFSLGLDLRKRARDLETSPIGAYLDGPFRALVAALNCRIPRFFEGIEDSSRAGERPFAELRDLQLTGEWLDRLETQRRLFAGIFPFELPAPGDLDLAGFSPADPADITLSDFFLTALANRILERPFFPQPIPREEVPVLHARVCQGGKVSQELRDETVRWLEALLPGAGAFGAWCLDLWEEEFCAHPPEDLDLPFVSGLILCG